MSLKFDQIRPQTGENVTALVPSLFAASHFGVPVNAHLIYEGHPINSGNFFIIRILIRLANQNYIVNMAKHVAHKIHCPKFISR